MFRRTWFFAVLLAAGACISTALRVDQTLSTDVADLATMKTIEITTQTGEVLLRGTLSEARDSSGKLERTASLTSPAGGALRGAVKVQIDRTNGLSTEEITIKLDELPYPESCRVMADGKELTMFTTSPQGKLEFRISRRVTLTNGRDR